MGISRYVDTVYWYFISVARKVKNNNTHFTVQFLFTQNFIIFMQFFEKLAQSYVGALPPAKWCPWILPLFHVADLTIGVNYTTMFAWFG